MTYKFYKIFCVLLIINYACNYKKKDAKKNTIEKFIIIEDTSIRIKQLPKLNNCDLFGGIKSGINRKELTSLLTNAIFEKKFFVDTIPAISYFCERQDNKYFLGDFLGCGRKGIYFNFLNDSGWEYGFRFEKFNSFNNKIFMVTLQSEHLNYVASAICEKYLYGIIHTKYGKPYYEKKSNTFHYLPTAEERLGLFMNNNYEFIHKWIVEDKLIIKNSREKICVEENNILWTDKDKFIEMESKLVYGCGDYGYNLIRPIKIVFKDVAYKKIEKILIIENEKRTKEREKGDREKIKKEIEKIKNQI